MGFRGGEVVMPLVIGLLGIAGRAAVATNGFGLGTTMPGLTGCARGTLSDATRACGRAPGGSGLSATTRCFATCCTTCACVRAWMRVDWSIFTTVMFLFWITVVVGATRV